MVGWWWVIPVGIAALGGLILIGGLVSLFRGKLFGGLFKTAVGGTILATALAATLLGQNIQTYARLTYERPVATIQLRKLGPQYFEAAVIQPATTEGGAARSALYPLHGDEWRIEAQVLKWKPWANVLGLDTQYRLDRLSGRYEAIEQERNGARSVHALSGGDVEGTVLGVTVPWSLSAWDAARRYRRWVDAVDTLYGGAAYMPMADGATYEVWINQAGLVARPANAAAQAASAGGWVAR